MTAEPNSVTGLWPVDRIVLGYLALTGVLIVSCWSDIEFAGSYLAAHIGAGLLVLLLARYPDHAWRHWYPLVYIALCYREMGILIRSVRRTNADAALVALDSAVWGDNPTIWLERIQQPWLTEVLQIVYALFVPSVILIGVILWSRKRLIEFRCYAFVVTFGFLLSYLGYLLVPARGPRFFLAGLQSAPLEGLWLSGPLRSLLDMLESAHYDCFPSGHVEMTVIAWWASRRISTALATAYAVYTGAILFATVYLRYHYTVDLVAGLAAAAAVIAIGPRLERNCLHV